MREKMKENSKSFLSLERVIIITFSFSIYIYVCLSLERKFIKLPPRDLSLFVFAFQKCFWKKLKFFYFFIYFKLIFF
jgi:hypothetical protein